jgi:hypothetical protein
MNEVIRQEMEKKIKCNCGRMIGPGQIYVCEQCVDVNFICSDCILSSHLEHTTSKFVRPSDEEIQQKIDPLMTSIKNIQDGAAKFYSEFELRKIHFTQIYKVFFVDVVL